jgi:hypothetical protein
VIPDLSRRLGRAVGTKQVTADERRRIADAADHAEIWDDLPADVRALVIDIEGRPDAW